MSELIVEMEMPTVCDECPMLYDGIVCAETGTEVYPNRQARILKNGRAFDPCENRLDDCPIVGVLPEEHGDLIDRDKAIFEMCEGIAPKEYRAWAKRYLKSEKINPTVIKAERKDDEQQ